MSKALVSTALLVTSLANAAWAGDCGFKTSPHHQAWPHLIAKYCCDDYRSKCMPCSEPVCRFVCDDYRPKCAPCAKPVCRFGCDDYCPKCPPILNCPRMDILRCPQPVKHHACKHCSK
jgi:hypothetical protein